MRSFDVSRSWGKRLADVIPAGAHTYAKADDQYPEEMAPVIERGSGCRVWDVDGNEYIEYGMGLRAVTLGHGFPAVTEAASRALDTGVNFVRPHPLEAETAEQLAEIVPCADMVKFAKNGSDVTTAAVKLARAATGRSEVAICSDSPFLSVDDWFIGTTELDAGVPEAVKELTVRFPYNDLEALREIFAAHRGEIACVVMEAERTSPPRAGYLAEVAELTRSEGALLVFDEMITGFRWALGGAQEYFGVEPDLAAFGKGLANGFSVSALVGRREIMDLGSLDAKTHGLFLLSTTHGAETHSLAAALATIATYRNEPVIEHLWDAGTQLERGINETVADLGLGGFFEVLGRPPNLVYATRGPDGNPSQSFRTLFLQETIERGLLAPSLVVSYAHDSDAIDQTVEIVGDALAVYKRALEGGIEQFLRGRPIRPALSRD